MRWGGLAATDVNGRLLVRDGTAVGDPPTCRTPFMRRAASVYIVLTLSGR